jgi:Ca2+-binding RTX toxin-like protein
MAVIKGTWGASNLAGTDAGNQLVGNSQANRIEGLGGDDTLLGGLGNDLVVSVKGSNDQVALQSWFDPAVDGVDYIGTGSDYMDRTAMNQLIQSMAAVAPASVVTAS